MDDLTIGYSAKHLRLMGLCAIGGFVNMGLWFLIWFIDKKPSPLQHFNVGMWSVLAVLLLAMYYRQRDADAIVLSESGLTYQQGIFTRSIALEKITIITSDQKNLVITGEGGCVLKSFKCSMYAEIDRLATRYTALKSQGAAS